MRRVMQAAYGSSVALPVAGNRRRRRDHASQSGERLVRLPQVHIRTHTYTYRHVHTYIYMHMYQVSVLSAFRKVRDARGPLLSNQSFRRQLLSLAKEHGLLGITPQRRSFNSLSSQAP